MDSGSYAACAGLLARWQQLDLAAQDLANVNTSGYRSQQSSFQSVLAQHTTQTESWSAALNSFGVLAASHVNRTSASLESTGNPLDFGIEGGGFFAVQTPQGVRYTLNGQFRVSNMGMLETHEGYPVLGEQGAMRVPEGAWSVSGDGTLSLQGALAGKLRLVEFAPGADLQAEGRGYYSAPANAALAATNSTVRQGALEGSNVNPVSSAVQLIEIQRTAQMLQNALTVFHGNFDRIAAEDLAKV